MQLYSRMPHSAHSEIALSISQPNSALACTQRPQKRRRQPETEPTPDQIPSPPRSTPTPDRPRKRAKTGQSGQDLQVRLDGTGRTPQFWDNLSQIPLVKAALEELERRNELAASARHNPNSLDSIRDQDLGCDLLHFARHGGPDLTGLRGISAREMTRPTGQPSRRSSGGIRKTKGQGKKRASGRGPGLSSSNKTGQSSRTTTDAKSQGPYDAAFRQYLADWNIFPLNYYLETGEHPAPPDNLPEITKVICHTSRSSLEPEAIVMQKFLEFQKAYDIATAEEPVSRTLDTIEGVTLALSSAHIKQGPVMLTNLHPLLPENLVPGYPDRTYGARPEKLDQSVRRELEHLILPTKPRDLVCPNFIVHVKGPSGDPKVAKVQAVYDGALAARGIEALWAYGSDDQDDQDGTPSARTITCTLTDGVLRMYAVHIRSHSGSPTLSQLQEMHRQSPSSPKQLEFVTSLIGSWLVCDRVDEFLRGATAFRNGLEWARQQRNEAIARANRRVEAGRQFGAHADSTDIQGAETCGSASQSSADPIS